MNTLFRVSEMQRCCGATVVGNGSFPVCAVGIDSREIVAGMLFCALPGSRSDGHAFVPEVLRRHAAALINRRHYRRFRHKLHTMVQATNSALMIVSDTYRALLRMAQNYLKQFQRVTRIAITGSNGKSTTKELVGAILSEHAPTYFTPGNRNSALGVSLAAFKVNERHEFALFETGTDYRGEIAQIASVLHPHYVLITNIGNAHIGIFGSQQAIAREKRNIARRSSALRALFLQEEEPYRALLAQGIKAPVITFGVYSTPGFQSFDTSIQGSTLVWRNRKIGSSISGAFQVNNILAAISLTSYIGCQEHEIAKGISKYRPLFGRAEYIPGTITVLQDCYNANPESMGKALDSLATLRWDGKIVCLLGSMKELGKDSPLYHSEIVRQALTLFNTVLFLYGSEFRIIKDNPQFPETDRIHWHHDMSQLCQDIDAYLQPGDLLFLKGSRIMQLEKVTEHIRKRQ